MKAHLSKLAARQSLSFSEAKQAAELILSDSASSEETQELLIALHAKKETTEEMEGFLAALRETREAFPELPPNLSGKLSGKLIDVCGTGGDGTNTFNVSTGVALVLASMGIHVAKHGNRSVSSLSGSSDVLQALQISGDTSIASALKSLEQHHLSFLYAPAFYPVLAKIAPIRKKIGTRTLFNALGPLLNPAPITHQLMGVYEKPLLEIAALSMKSRGIRHALVVHGADGLDELTLSSETHAVSLENGNIQTLNLTPEDFGFTRAPLAAVRGGSPAENAQILLDIYAGDRSAKRDLLVMNAAAALSLVEGHQNFKESVAKVESAIDSGVTLKFVKGLRQTS